MNLRTSSRARIARAPALTFVALGVLGLGACQTAPVPHSGFLSSYEGQTRPRSLRAAVHQRRDDGASDAVERVYLAPAVLLGDAGAVLDDGERAAVLREIDQETCFRISRRFTVVSEPAPDTATIRTGVVQINPTGRAASAVSAIGGMFIPVPLLDVRLPRTTGGLAIESEMLAPDGSQIAHLTWARNANVVGMDSPSLSRIGDALEMAGEAGKAIDKAYASEAREKQHVGDPDPCEQFGPRRNIPRWIAGKAFGSFTGLHAPEISGTARPAPEPAAPVN